MQLNDVSIAASGRGVYNPTNVAKWERGMLIEGVSRWEFPDVGGLFDLSAGRRRCPSVVVTTIVAVPKGCRPYSGKEPTMSWKNIAAVSGALPLLFVGVMATAAASDEEIEVEDEAAEALEDAEEGVEEAKEEVAEAKKALLEAKADFFEAKADLVDAIASGDADKIAQETEDVEEAWAAVVEAKATLVEAIYALKAAKMTLMSLH